MGERSKTLNEKSCGILIVHDEDFLLLHYPQGHWDFVKGHVEPDESETETALRELEEESGISEVEVVDGFREEMHYFFKHEEQLISKTVVYFLGRVGDKEIEISHEHQNFDWLPFKEAKERLTFKNAKEILEKAYNFLV
ncbi:bis(5'-nucleosyl)-tetraphosphatase [Patescibacteria group bacterium]